MNIVDQVISQAHKDNQILGVLLGVLMDGGRIISTSETISQLLSLVPDVFFFEQKKIDSELSDLCAKDLVFVDQLSVDQLWDLAGLTSAQIAIITDHSLNEALYDYCLKEPDLRSALMDVRTRYEEIRRFKSQVYFDGSRLNKALFLDRDGVLIEDVGYIKSPEDVRIIPECIEVLRKAKGEGFKLVVITNQSGIGRGLFPFAAYEKVNDKLQSLFAKEGIVFDRIIKAPFFEKSQFASGLVRKSLRKPRPGMIHSVVSDLRIDISNSILVGDSATDLMAGALAGVGRVILLNSAKAKEEMEIWTHWSLRSRYEPDQSRSSQGSWSDVTNLINSFLN